MDLLDILKKVVENKAPDLHLKVGMPPIVRLPNGDLYPLEGLANLTEATILAIGEHVAGPQKFAIFKEHREADFSYGAKDVGRFRVNLYLENDGPSMAFRVINDKIPSFEDLMLPPVSRSLALKPRGLVLVTGPTGSGKSTTIASMIDLINSSRRCHILTVEDPIEYIHTSKSSVVTQREVNHHTESFLTAIRSSLRQDPDVIMVGEMRDLEAISAAITLAETGHLVFSTLHTNDAVQTIDRIIDVFPSNQQQQIRAQLSACLEGVISQTLIPRKDTIGRVAAYEVMIVNEAISSCIKEGKTHNVLSLIQIGKEKGMMTLDDSLLDLVTKGLISEKSAFSKARDAEYLRMNLHS